MRVVSENSETDLARRQAVERVRWALREMTANLLRVVRGAGKSHEIVNQTAELLQALASYRDVVGTFPPVDELDRFLRMGRDFDAYMQYEEQVRARISAEESIVRGALQMAASQLIGQSTQEAAGRHEMYGGLNAIVDMRTAERKAPFSPAKRARSRVTAAQPRKPKA